MILNDKYKFVFTHIPKSGGTFVRHVLLNIPETYINNFNQDAHTGISKLPKKYENYHIITCIRNPMEWYASLYFHIVKNNFDKNDLEWLAFGSDEKNFNEWFNKIINFDVNDEFFDKKITSSEQELINFIYQNNIKINYGWWTYHLFYQILIDYKKFIIEDDLNNFYKSVPKKLFILKNSTLREDLINVFHKLKIPKKYDKIPLYHEKVNVGIEKISKYKNLYNEKELKFLKTKEKLIYDILIKCQ